MILLTYACVQNANLCDNCIVNRRAGVSENDTSSNGDVKIYAFFRNQNCSDAYALLFNPS